MISVGYVKTLDEQIDSNTAQAAKIAKDLKATKSSAAALSELSADPKTVSLDSATTQLMLKVFNGRTIYDINLAQTSTGKIQAGAAIAAIDKASELVKGTNLKNVRVTMRGEYQNIEGLESFIESLRKDLPVAVVFLKIQDQQFELAVRVFGK